MNFMSFSGLNCRRVSNAWRSVPLLALLAACATPMPDEAGGQASDNAPVATAPVVSEARRNLDQGLSYYANGEYDLANLALRRALGAGLAQPEERISAHKHLAFILCVNGNPSACANQFRQVLAIDPAFELDKAEAGHPMWGPVFAKVRKEASGTATRRR